MRRRFLILHGQGDRRLPTHWQWWLTEQLRRRGEHVLYPQFPDPDEPDLQTWLELLLAEYAQLGPGERVVVCHGLGCALWYQAAAHRLLARPADRLLLVAPPGRDALAGPSTTAFSGRWDRDVLHDSAARIELVAANNDPHCADGPAAALYGRPLGLRTHVVAGGGSLSIEDGYGTWPAVYTWCVAQEFRTSRAVAI